MGLHRCVVFLLLSIRLYVAAGNDIAILTDANFEHDTQATTGSTTGRWLVLFHNGNDAGLKTKLTDRVEEGGEETTMLDALLEAGVVVGMMDISTNPSTVKRLNIPGAPHAVVLSKGKMYRTNSLEELQDFAISEYEIVNAEDIPPIPSPLDVLLSNSSDKMAWAGVAGSMVLLVLALIARGLTAKPTPVPKKKN